jgi:capsular polysaccharide biosynthesis protein
MTTDAPIDATVRFRELWHRVARRWRTAATVALLCMAVALTMGLSTPREYTATATLTVFPMTLDPFSSSSSNQQINIQTEREVISSSEVAAIAAEQLGGSVSPGTLLGSSSVGAPSQSQVLQVSVTAGNPEDAAERANAMAAAYLEFRSQGATEVAEERIKALDERIDDIESSNAGSGQLNELREERSGLELVGSNPGRIIGVASPPSNPSSLGLSSFLAAGAAAGLLLAAAVALVRDLRDRRVRFPERLSEATGKSVYVLRRFDDEEAFRWILRVVREPFSGSRRTRPLVVSIFGLPGTASHDALMRLTATAEAANLVVHSIPASELPENDLDDSWRYQPDKGARTNIVLIDASRISSAARRANLADGSDAFVILASAGNELRAVHALLENISAAKTNVVPVFAAAATAGRAKPSTAGKTAPGTRGAEHSKPSATPAAELPSPAFSAAEH